MRKREIIHVGPDGLAIDRKHYQEQWQHRIIELRETDPVVQRILAGETVSAEEWEALAIRLNAPDFWFDEAALRKAFDQPSGSLSDFIRAALGLYAFPTREQRIERAFRAWVAEHSDSIKPEQARILNLLRNVAMAAARETRYDLIKPDVFNRAPFTLLGGRAKMDKIFGREQLDTILGDLRRIIEAA